jgi:hypothetical protein
MHSCKKTNYTVNCKTVVRGSKAQNILNLSQSTVFWLLYSVSALLTCTLFSHSPYGMTSYC